VRPHERGRATTVTITVINQPSKVLDRGQTIVLSVRQDTCAGSYIRGVPRWR